MLLSLVKRCLMLTNTAICHPIGDSRNHASSHCLDALFIYYLLSLIWFETLYFTTNKKSNFIISQLHTRQHLVMLFLDYPIAVMVAVVIIDVCQIINEYIQVNESSFIKQIVMFGFNGTAVVLNYLRLFSWTFVQLGMKY